MILNGIIGSLGKGSLSLPWHASATWSGWGLTWSTCHSVVCKTWFRAFIAFRGISIYHTVDHLLIWLQMCFLPASLLVGLRQLSRTLTARRVCACVCLCEQWHFFYVVNELISLEPSDILTTWRRRLHRRISSQTSLSWDGGNQTSTIVFNKDGERLSDGFSRCMSEVIEWWCAAACPPVNDGGVWPVSGGGAI